MYAQEEDEETYEFVQLDDKTAANDHWNDTDDIPDGQDPVGLVQKRHSHSKSLADSLVQLDSKVRYDAIPHENDTEDITQDKDEENLYNRHHSKLWNEVVNRKAQELEDTMKAEETLKVEKKKAAERAKLQKAEQAHKRALEQKKREQAAREQKDHEAHRTVDFSELYGSMVGDTANVQLEYVDHWKDKRHSKYWADRVKDESIRTNKLLAEGQREINAEESTHNPHHFKTNDLESEYDGMLLQTGEGFVDHW